MKTLKFKALDKRYRLAIKDAFERKLKFFNSYYNEAKAEADIANKFLSILRSEPNYDSARKKLLAFAVEFRRKNISTAFKARTELQRTYGEAWSGDFNLFDEIVAALVPYKIEGDNALEIACTFVSEKVATEKWPITEDVYEENNGTPPELRMSKEDAFLVKQFLHRR